MLDVGCHIVLGVGCHIVLGVGCHIFLGVGCHIVLGVGCWAVRCLVGCRGLHWVWGVGCGVAHCVMYCTIRCHFACGVSQIVFCIVLSAVVLDGELCLVRDVTLFGYHITCGLFCVCEN